MADHADAIKKTDSSVGVKARQSMSMHEDVPVWYDCCSCEAEPYWVEAFDQDTCEDNEQGEMVKLKEHV